MTPYYGNYLEILQESKDKVKSKTHLIISILVIISSTLLIMSEKRGFDFYVILMLILIFIFTIIEPYIFLLTSLIVKNEVTAKILHNTLGVELNKNNAPIYFIQCDKYFNSVKVGETTVLRPPYKQSLYKVIDSEGKLVDIIPNKIVEVYPKALLEMQYEKVEFLNGGNCNEKWK